LLRRLSADRTLLWIWPPAFAGATRQIAFTNLRLFSGFPLRTLSPYDPFAYTVICTSSGAVIARNEGDDPNPEEFHGTSTIRRSGGSDCCAGARHARPRCDRDPVVARHDRRQQRR